MTSASEKINTFASAHIAQFRTLRQNKGGRLIDALDSTDSSAVAAVKSQPSEQLLEDILFIDSDFKIVSKSIILMSSEISSDVKISFPTDEPQHFTGTDIARTYFVEEDMKQVTYGPYRV
ncbi:hypothetical protein ANN_05925 [Periplaneta americana]|uniref:Uncharacterized protein n=1 Tax=Periplaneta americana TaxID=6978 RepID=A0ABQ8TDU4_PERAM|nr:hypothetical protein ANN_05925 [Periplaneta americana]